MTVSAYIQSNFQTFGITISEAELLGMSIRNSLDTTQDLTAQNMTAVDTAIARFIPSLLARPQSISEGGFSMSFNPDSLKEYYSALCTELGIENVLSGVRDASDCW